MKSTVKDIHIVKNLKLIIDNFENNLVQVKKDYNIQKTILEKLIEEFELFQD